MPRLGQKEKNKLKTTLPFDIAKKFMNNLMTWMDLNDEDYILMRDKYDLKPTKLTLKFQLKEDAVDKLITDIETNTRQRRLTDTSTSTSVPTDEPEPESEEKELNAIPDLD